MEGVAAAAAPAVGQQPPPLQSEEEEAAAWQAYLEQMRSGVGFAQYYRCRPMALAGIDGADDGNRVVMPQSALDRLSTSSGVDYPLVFRVQNAATLQASHCGVLEFVAEEGFVHVPARTMARLGLKGDDGDGAGGDLVLITATSLPKATSVTLRPHTADFHRVKHPKELLEYNFQKNTRCVTVGETVTVDEGDRRYLLDVVEAKPADAVSTLDTDCEVDFAEPLDYVEPKVAPPAPVKGATGQDETTGEERRFVGVGMRLDGKPMAPPAPAAAGSSSSDKGKNVTSEHVLRFSGGSAAAAHPAAAKWAKKVDGEKDKEEAKRFRGNKIIL